MRTLGVLTVVVTALLLGVAAQTAPAATPFTAGTGETPRVAVAPDGRAHVVWSIPGTATTPAAVGYCRIPAGVDACDVTRTLAFTPALGSPAGGGVVNVFAVSSSRIVIVASCSTCIAASSGNHVVSFTSNDGGATAPVEAPLGLTPTAADIGADGTWVDSTPSVFVAPAEGFQVGVMDGASF
ncbi:MAG TPA: hypothetical protein VII98_09055, partial [Solirubrobacteraceae bacterium]